MGSARRITQRVSEDTRWTVAGSSWQVQGMKLLRVPLVAVTGTFTEGKCKLRLSVSTLHLIKKGGKKEKDSVLVYDRID